MKRPASALTLPDLIEVIRGSGLLSEAAVRAIAVQWKPGADGAADVAGCARWLAAQGYLTEYQLALLMHGHAAALVLGRYRLLDRIGRFTNPAAVAAALRAEPAAPLTVAAAAHTPPLETGGARRCPCGSGSRCRGAGARRAGPRGRGRSARRRIGPASWRLCLTCCIRSNPRSAGNSGTANTRWCAEKE